MAKALAEGNPLIASLLGTAVPTDDVAVALNTAFMGDGALVHIARDTKLDRPIHLVFAFGSDTAAASFTRSLIVAEEGARPRSRVARGRTASTTRSTPRSSSWSAIAPMSIT